MIRVRMPQKKKELETQGKRLLTKDQRVEDGETVDIISVVSGG
jgi:hypothetical protein